MNTPRRFAGHVVLADRLYVLAGWDDRCQVMNSVEYYDAHKRFAPAACVSNGLIYVLGGWRSGKGMLVPSIERYEPQTNTWTEVSSPTTISFRWIKNCSMKTILFLIFLQLEFALTVPRYRQCCAVTDGNWVYLAGGEGSRDSSVTFQKVHVITGEVITLENLQRPCTDYPLLKFQEAYSRFKFVEVVNPFRSEERMKMIVC